MDMSYTEKGKIYILISESDYGEDAELFQMFL